MLIMKCRDTMNINIAIEIPIIKNTEELNTDEYEISEKEKQIRQEIMEQINRQKNEE